MAECGAPIGRQGRLFDQVSLALFFPFFGSETFLLLPALCFLFVVDVDVVDVVVDVAAQANFGYLFR